jgi:hypothetical protein
MRYAGANRPAESGAPVNGPDKMSQERGEMSQHVAERLVIERLLAARVF